MFSLKHTEKAYVLALCVQWKPLQQCNIVKTPPEYSPHIYFVFWLCKNKYVVIVLMTLCFLWDLILSKTGLTQQKTTALKQHWKTAFMTHLMQFWKRGGLYMDQCSLWCVWEHTEGGGTVEITVLPVFGPLQRSGQEAVDGTLAGPVGVQHFTEVACYCRALTAVQLHSLVSAEALTHSSAEHT